MKKTIDFDESRFYSDLLAHTWSYVADSFYEFIKRSRKEKQLLEVAIKGGPSSLRSFQHEATDAMIRAVDPYITSRVLERTELFQRNAEEARKKITDIQSFADACKYFDWYYEYIDNAKQYNSASARLTTLVNEAREGGKLYMIVINNAAKNNSYRALFTQEEIDAAAETPLNLIIKD